MADHFEARLRGHLGKLIENDRTSIDAFQQWFTTAWWEAEDGASEALYSFGSRIEHLLYIWSSGEWSDGQLRDELKRNFDVYRLHGRVPDEAVALSQR